MKIARIVTIAPLALLILACSQCILLFEAKEIENIIHIINT